MQVFNSNINFKSISYYSPREKVIETMQRRLKKNELDGFIQAFEKSPVKVQFGLADLTGDRLDVTIRYSDTKNASAPKEKYFDYMEENRLSNLLNISPKGFIKKVLSKVDSLEETYMIGKYAK